MGATHVKFRWQPVRGVVGYDLRIARDVDFTLEMHTFRVKGPGLRKLLDRGTWHWVVRSIGPEIESRWSEARQFQLKPRRDIVPPKRPLKLRVRKAGKYKATLIFRRARDPFGIKRYRVFADGKRVTAGRARRVTRQRRAIGVRRLGCGTVYTFTVKAVDRAGNVSDASPPARVRHVRAPTCSRLMRSRRRP